MKFSNIKIAALAVTLATVSFSCSSDFTETVFNQDEIAGDWKTPDQMHSFVLGAYVDMRSANYYGKDFQLLAEVRSDEMFSNGASGYYRTVYNYTMTSADAYALNTYDKVYKVIAKANSVINFDINKLQSSAAVKDKANYYVGQAFALRAQGFFDLLRLYGQKYTGGETGVVLPLKYDPSVKQGRASIVEVEKQIENDFTSALQKMTGAPGIDNPENRTELSVNGLKGLMTRYYLYKQDYSKVSALANDIVSSGKYKVIDKDAFVNSWTVNGAANNSIFELAFGKEGMTGSTSYGNMINSGGYGNVVIKPTLYNEYASEDVRRNVIKEVKGTYYLDGKYPNITGSDNVRIVRYEEVILNGAEAEVKLGNQAKALEYYNMIVTNRGLSAAANVTLEDIQLERSKELLGEGFRMWDMLRWGKTIERPITAKTDIRLLAFPIPRVETDLSGTLVTSNPGYDN
ncbi:glycan metabolism protein [Elizabethkingia ursingii]|uniref:RagB/SusD family nutrient uptake outer membrane protein n=1 Tax=Elizabethkingia ursingii TaxID=1756150 RepID=UPI000999453A|nr:RagB/SusD family nutrient uptake outer membrane protein [Elizabethkingia ursingii]OPC01244.1 glycan metabolism protein [Elizabethkingia ursingii]